MSSQIETAWESLQTAITNYQLSNPEDESMTRFVESLRESDPEIYEELHALLADFYYLCNSTANSFSSSES